MKSTDKRCYNCKYASGSFKIGKLTHHHCSSPTYEKQHKQGVVISPWETLRVFSDTCDEHEFNNKRQHNQIEIKQAEFIKKHGFKEGDKIAFKGPQIIHKGIVLSVQFHNEDPIGLIVSLFDKNLKPIDRKMLICEDQIKEAVLLSNH